MSLVKAKLKNRLLRARLKADRLPPEARANLGALDRLQPNAPARNFEYVVVDLETTGLDINEDRVVSVGAVRVRQGKVILGERFVELVNPGCPVSVDSIRIHGLKPDKLQTARPARQVFRDFLGFLGDSVLVAHHAPFDLHFINRTMKGLYGFPLQSGVLDTELMCRSVLLPSDPYGINRHGNRCSLDALAARFGIKNPGRHTAFGDALATALIFQRLLTGLEKEAAGDIRSLWRAAAL